MKRTALKVGMEVAYTMYRSTSMTPSCHKATVVAIDDRVPMGRRLTLNVNYANDERLNTTHCGTRDIVSTWAYELERRAEVQRSKDERRVKATAEQARRSALKDAAARLLSDKLGVPFSTVREAVEIDLCDDTCVLRITPKLKAALEGAEL